MSIIFTCNIKKNLKQEETIMRLEFTENGLINLVSNSKNTEVLTKCNLYTLETQKVLCMPDYSGVKEYGATNKESTLQTLETVAMFLRNISTLGYTLTTDSVKLLIDNPKEYTEYMLTIFLRSLKQYTGDNIIYRPFYPNFPEEVIETPMAVKIINQYIHYISGGTITLPQLMNQKNVAMEKTAEDLPELQGAKLTKIRIVTDFEKCTFDHSASMITAKTSIKQSDKDWFQFFFGDRSCNFTTSHVDACGDITIKENLVFMVSVIMNNGMKESLDALSAYFRIATDVLRLAVAISGGDISLAEVKKTRFKQFTSKERKLFMHLLNNLKYNKNKYSDYLFADMRKYKSTWLRFSERIHPGSYSYSRYGRVINAFDSLHKGDKIDTINTRIEEMMKTKEITEELVDIISDMPSIFARRVDAMLRNASTDRVRNYIIRKFNEVANQIEISILVELYKYYSILIAESSGLINYNVDRCFNIKSSVGTKYYVLEDNRVRIDVSWYNKMLINIRNGIGRQVAELSYLGNYYIDPELKNYPVPLKMRADTHTDRPIGKGASLPIKDDTNYLRLFTWWTNVDGEDRDRARVDIDLSVTYMDEDFCLPNGSFDFLDYRTLGHVRHFGNTKRPDYIMGIHSGDFTDGGHYEGEGVAEFIDIPLDNFDRINRELVKEGKKPYRYIAVQIFSFNGYFFNEMNHLRSGYMEMTIDDETKGKMKTYYSDNIHYIPSNVELAFNLSAKTTKAICLAYDIKERRIIWIDQTVGANERTYCNNTENTAPVVVNAMMQTVLGSRYNMSLYDLFDIHGYNRGVRVESEEEADIIFSAKENLEGKENVVSAFDIATITNDYI